MGATGMKSLSHQIAIETTTRCGGDCAGCALTSMERMDPSGLQKEVFTRQLNLAIEQIKKTGRPIDAISIFFGQGDHFLMSEAELVDMAKAVGEAWPDEWKARTVFFITASAVTKQELLKIRAKALRVEGIKNRCNWFVQVVFDPKKFLSSKKFAKTYLENIQFLKNEFTMAELTVNLSGEVPDTMSPAEFHAWVLEHQFKHVEMNWVAREALRDMWVKDTEKTWAWLMEWTRLAWMERRYEINYMPWTLKRFNGQLTLDEEATYITGDAVLLPAQVGPIANVTPLVDRLTKDLDTSKMMREKTKTFATRMPCATCDRNKMCAESGVFGLTQFMPKVVEGACPWGVKGWWDFITTLMRDAEDVDGGTVFDKNPAAHESLLMEEHQGMREYFEGGRVRYGGKNVQSSK